MKKKQKDIREDKKALIRFIQRVRLLSSTPDLIRLIAGDAGYLLLCGAIVKAFSTDRKNSEFVRRLEDVCRTQHSDIRQIWQKLIPASQALGLSRFSDSQLDYYDLLGIAPAAGAAEIRQAFRKRVRTVHPDTTNQEEPDSREFIQLNAAYKTLVDPILRQQYDRSRQKLRFWNEKPNQNPSQKRWGRTRIIYQIGIIFLFLIAAVFIFDYLHRQNAINAGF